ncbi:cytochrome d ubiquinol oxidase subunit I [Streptomyces sp. SAI-144]|uniref:cytochrome ubiquinol oxidase subunit I n=1 Tax=Streptomyces sp. SAI-144 TaxID=2940544 RepID=UPI002474208E|nr:cytochrome ubiquinol oxidase subunit I [Streptomyces sp. SAI-144]MDH6436258.1 cytochrome d ubiquinol oxidase subunit I [Streptomyces sp. SAI-144]
MSLLDLSRWQFAITVMFHMTFPAITVGLSVLLCVLYGMHWRTDNPVYLQMFRFWRRIFAVGFAIGVVAGIVITFEMGLNWGVYAAETGPVIGPIIGMEVVTAFFVEAGFIGILLYGDGRVQRRTMFTAAVMVSLGTVLSSTWIIAANSWLQTPAGFVFRHGQFEPVDWVHAIFNPSFLWRWPHMLAAVMISASFFVAGIGAYYLVKGRALAFARRSVSIALGVAAILLPLQLFLGDHVAGAVLPRQLSKLEALEGNWGSANKGYVIFSIPDQQAERNIAELSVPCLGSAIAKDLTCTTPTPGLDLTPKADRPDMAAVFWGFRGMFYAALLMFGTVFYATILRLRRKLWTARLFHRFLMWSTPVGIIAVLGGWVTAESGRQPWVVFGHLRTSAAVSRLAPGELLFSVVGFSLLYLVMLAAYVVYIVRALRTGPERDHPDPAGVPRPAPHPLPQPGAVAPGPAMAGEAR